MIEAAPEEHGVSMSGAEWRERFQAMLIAGAIKEEQWRVLSHARIEDGDDASLEMKRAMERLTPRQFTDLVQLMLAANPSFCDQGERAELATSFGGNRIIDEGYLRMRTEGVNGTLRLIDDEMPSLRKAGDIEKNL